MLNMDIQGENDDILAWARNARPGTQLAPPEAPDGQEMATFAGVRYFLFYFLSFCVIHRRSIQCTHIFVHIGLFLGYRAGVPKGPRGDKNICGVYARHETQSHL